MSNRVKSELDPHDSNAHRGERILLGIAILHRIALPGVCYTYDDIAEFAGCTGDAILLTERRALRKLRNRLRFLNDAVLRELAIEFFDRRTPATRARREESEAAA